MLTTGQAGKEGCPPPELQRLVAWLQLHLNETRVWLAICSLGVAAFLWYPGYSSDGGLEITLKDCITLKECTRVWRGLVIYSRVLVVMSIVAFAAFLLDKLTAMGCLRKQ